jgi:hypothetical protein
MNTPRESNPDPTDGRLNSAGSDRDESLRQALRALPQDRAEVDALAARVMAQWREREALAVAAPATVGHGLAALGGRGHARARWIGIAGLLTGAAIALVLWAHRPDPALDELLQPDVLSQMAIGEM